MLNLKKSIRNFSFFSYLDEIQNIIQDKKNEAKRESFFGIYKIGKTEAGEIGRGYGYAVFPELKNNKMTIERLRDSLSSRDVTNRALQNKLIFMIIQQRGSAHFFLTQTINFLVDKYNSNAGSKFESVNNSYAIEMNVLGPNSVDLIISAKSSILDSNGFDLIPAFVINTKLNISLEKCIIKDFNIDKLSNQHDINNIYDYFCANQQGILEIIINFIKKLFGYTDDLILEETLPDDIIWEDAEFTKSSKKGSFRI